MLLFIGLFTLMINFGKSFCLETDVIDGGQVVDDVIMDDPFLMVTGEFCDEPKDIMPGIQNLTDAKQMCLNDDTCTQFYDEYYQLDGATSNSYYKCYQSSIIKKDSDSDHYHRTMYKPRCEHNSDCGNSNFCYSGQCYKLNPDVYCKGNRVSDTPYQNIDSAAEACSIRGDCRCLEDENCDGLPGIFLFSSTTPGSQTGPKEACATVKLGNYYEPDDQPTTTTTKNSSSGKYIGNTSLLITLIVCLQKYLQ